MGVFISSSLRTRTPEDLKKVVDYAIEQTKIQSLKDTGEEWLPCQEVREGEHGFIVEDTYLTWVDSSYYKKHLNMKELLTNIAKQYPDIEFIYSDYEHECCEEYEYLWDGNEWKEMKELVLGMVIECDDKVKLETFVPYRLQPICNDANLNLTEVTYDTDLYVRCQFTKDATEQAFSHIHSFLEKIMDFFTEGCTLYGIVAEYQSQGEWLLKKVVIKEKGIEWLEATEEEQHNFEYEMTAKEVHKAFHHMVKHELSIHGSHTQLEGIKKMFISLANCMGETTVDECKLNIPIRMVMQTLVGDSMHTGLIIGMDTRNEDFLVLQIETQDINSIKNALLECFCDINIFIE